jgi:hypothetical protein
LRRLDGVEDDIVEKEDSVELDAVAVDGRKSAVPDFGEESDALKSLVPVG